MYGNRKIWKLSARRALSGRWGTLIVAQVIVSAINLVAGNLTMMLFPGYDGLSLILSQVFSFLVSLVMCIFTAGLYYMYLNVARGKEYSYKNLIYFFKNQPDKIIVASFVMAAIAWLTALPAGYYIYVTDPGTTLEQQMAVMQTYLMISLGGIILNMLLTVPLTLTYFILADENVGGLEALKRSMQLMRGNIGTYILLQLSFLPWYFLCLFTMGIGIIFLMPYIQMTGIMFYRDIKGEIYRQEPQAATADREEKEQDDYNSEA